MRTQEFNRTNNKLLNLNFRVLVVFYITLYFLAIFQDYIFSRIKFTGFYWSDTMLYNIYWLLFIPFIQIAHYVYNKVQPKTPINKFLYASTTGFFFSALHIFLFTQFLFWEVLLFSQ